MDSHSKETQWLLQEKYHGEKSEAFFADCKRLALGEPLAYLIGYVPFLDCTIWLDSHPLIPRAETEFWTEKCINSIQERHTLSLGFADKPLRILDMCAGSGCIGIALAKAFPIAHVEFAEIDNAHISTIKKNLTANGISPERTTIHHTNLFTGIEGTFDLIVSNPPYIDEQNSRAEASVVAHEPHLALYGGQDGMETIKTIIDSLHLHLAQNGQLWLEHEPEQIVKIAVLAERNNYTSTTYQDQYHVDRFTVVQ